MMKRVKKTKMMVNMVKERMGEEIFLIDQYKMWNGI